nr:M28 family peptidase [Saprospiraceae bacterium]
MTTTYKLLAAMSLAFVFSLASCGTEERPGQVKETETTTPEVRSLEVPMFNADSAFQFIADQLEFGSRVPGTEAHRACRDYFVEKMNSFGAQVEVQEFNARLFPGQSTIRCYNIIARFNPQNRQRILLAAHWDSRYVADHDPVEANRTLPVPGADDGASGVGVLMEIARKLGNNPIGMGVDIVFFDAEDQGKDGGRDSETWGIGAQRWSQNIARSSGPKPRYGILLDMVGASNPRFGREGFSVRYAPDAVDKVWRVAQQLGYGRFFVNQQVPGVIDDHYFVNTIAQIPMINIINRPPGTNTGFVPHWHTISDDLDAIDKSTFHAVVHTVLEVLYREDADAF